MPVAALKNFFRLESSAGFFLILAWLFFQQPITSIMVASMALILVGLHLMLATAPRSGG